MRDLHLWRLLQSPLRDPGEAASLLEELGALPLAERVPFLGFLPLAHGDASVRRAAVGALAGCTGRPALQKMALALGDADESVRLAAVEALRDSLLGGDWARWVHVLFHPEPGVRLAGVAAEDFPPPFLYKLYLLPDPACRLAVEQQMMDAQIDGEGLPLLFDFLRRGVVFPRAARRLARKVSWNEWLGFLGDLVPRHHDLTETLRSAMRPDWPEDLFSHYRADRLDEMLLLFWESDPPEEAESPHAAFFELLWEAALAESTYFRQWLVFTMLGVAVQRQSWPERAAGLCAVLYPPFLACAWVPEGVRRGGLSSFYRAGPRCPRFAPEVIRPLVQSEVCRTPAGLDLWAVGAVLHAVESHPYQNLLAWVPLREIAPVFQADLERAMPLLSVPDTSKMGRTFLLRELCLLQGAHRFRMLALVAQAVDSAALGVLDTLDGAGACRLLEELLALEAGPLVAGLRPFTENKVLRLSTLLAKKIAAGQVERFFGAWLSREKPEASALAPAILARLIHNHDTRLIHPALVRQPAALLRRFLVALPFCAGFPYDDEIRLAENLASHEDDSLRSWALARLSDHEAVLAAREGEEEPSPREEPPVLRLGIVEHLLAKPGPAEPNVETCQALLASHDPPDLVAALFGRYASGDGDLLTRLDAEMVRHWQGELRLPFLGHAWLYRWDAHLAALAGQLDPDGADQLPFPERNASGALRWSLGLSCEILRRRIWQAVAAVLEHWRWRGRELLHAAWEQTLAEVLLDGVHSDVGDLAARVILHWRDHAGSLPQAGLLEPLRQRLVALMPELSDEMRQRFSGWIDTRGLVPRQEAPAEEAPAVEAPAERTVEELALLTLGEDETLAASGASRLLALGEPWWQRLARAVEERPDVRWPLHLLDALRDCPSVELKSALRQLVGSADSVPEVAFRVGGALWGPEEHSVLADLLAAVRRPGPVGWFTATDCGWLRDYGPMNEVDLCGELAGSHHPAAYLFAVERLTSYVSATPEIRTALLEFLEAGTGRMRDVRLQAARWLYDHGEREEVLPILLGKAPQKEPPQPALLAGVPGPVVLGVTSGILMAGQGEAAEEMLLGLLTHGGPYGLGGWGRSVGSGDRVDPLARQDALGQMLSGATTLAVRQRVRKALRSGLGRSHKLRRVAETFAWGVRVGRQLTGKLFSVEMIAGEELGYTRLRENKIYVSPMPLLRGQQNAREVVRGLILHEYGHHLYHKGEEAEAVWEQAEQEKLGRLLNLVSDEHLERNLRVRDGAYGDMLKQLGAYAFQHTAREVSVEALLAGLRGEAFGVLSNTHLGVARKPGCVVVSSGKVLLQMEKAGMSFARFVRALRMGLGNRHRDAKVGRALELFKGRFRHSGMAELMEVTRKLREIFGEETDLLEVFNQDSALVGEADELADASEGITNEELQAEVRRALEGPTGKERRGGGRGYNVGPEEDFEPITNVVPKMHDPVRHAAYADRVARHAEKMRRYLRQLGLGLEPQRLRVRGKSFDRTRARAVVLRGDPRMLVARELRMQTDLFLGVLIDCSGSMASGENIEKAKLFGTLLAEAARGNRGMDVRLWGFTDRTIYDCGNAGRPAVHDLSPEDGNNDAAALWHAALAARASRRKAKLLVMISDGSPTGCSVNALTALVRRLTRRMKILCAQVAVRPLDDISFPHYVLLEDDRVDESVKRFGAIMMKLVRQALRG
jgi:hypothetical protein